MYFEDIFNKVKPLWSKDIYIEDFVDDEISFNKLSKYYEDKIEESHNEEEYSASKYWCELINWSIYVVLSTESEKLAKTGRKKININEIPIKILEERFRQDLQSDSWEEERKQYKGFKNPLQEV